MSKDYYKILGVSKEASESEIKKAYRKMAHKYHPDKQGGDEDKFKEVNEAYQVLSNPSKRSQYDQFGSDFSSGAGGGGGFDFSGFQKGGFDFSGFQGFSSSEGGGFEDVFSDFFSSGGGFGSSGNSRQPVGSDISVDATITFEEMAKGVEQELDLYKRVLCKKCDGTGAKDGKTKKCSACGGSGKVEKTARSILGMIRQVVRCDTCQGRGFVPEKKCSNCGGDGVVRDYQKVKINIPAGIENGQTIKVSGYGEYPIGGGLAGDLYVNVHVKEHSEFFREGNNILSYVRINFSQAVLGDKIKINTIDGPLKVKVPSGSQPGDVLKIKGKGVQALGRFSRGDHLLKIKIEIPTKLSGDQKRLVKKIQEEGL